MNPADTQAAGAAALALAMLALTTAMHYEALELLGRRASGQTMHRRRVVGLLTALVGLHVAEVALYALAYHFGALLGLGHLRGGSGRALLDVFYFAAETYSTLGYGDVVPTGDLRLVASVEALNGLLLIAWSGAFLFGVLEGARKANR
ncbi:MAG TPA: potassium channel family protein [Burkholderiales bacterium]|nr:potassium channel family protein [Burkholderiales bacterium]